MRTTLLKKWRLSNPENSRVITLTWIVSKIYTKLLRIKYNLKSKWIRSNRSTTIQILTVRRIIDAFKVKNIEAIIIFIISIRLTITKILVKSPIYWGINKIVNL